MYRLIDQLVELIYQMWFIRQKQGNGKRSLMNVRKCTQQVAQFWWVQPVWKNQSYCLGYLLNWKFPTSCWMLNQKMWSESQKLWHKQGVRVQLLLLLIWQVEVLILFWAEMLSIWQGWKYGSIWCRGLLNLKKTMVWVWSAYKELKSKIQLKVLANRRRWKPGKCRQKFFQLSCRHRLKRCWKIQCILPCKSGESERYLSWWWKIKWRSLRKKLLLKIR